MINFQFTEQREQPTALNVRISMKLFLASHESSSPAVAEAQKLLISAIEKLSATVSKATAGNTVFAVITVGEHHSNSRAKRQTGEEVSHTSIK